MDISSVHEPTTVWRARSYVRLTWECTCGAFSAGTYARSRTELRIQYELDHRHPEFADALPAHDIVLKEGEFGGPAWACTCGEQGRPEGHPNERRARQSHSRHAARFTAKWLDAAHQHSLSLLTPQQRRSREAMVNWYRKDAATRAQQAEYVLSQIL